jgi:hypothetical protein
MGVSGQLHALSALYPRGKGPRYPLNMRLGGMQRLEEKLSASVGDRIPVIQFVVTEHFILLLLKMEACSVKRVAGNCIDLCVYICQFLLFVKISYFQCRNSVKFAEYNH